MGRLRHPLVVCRYVVVALALFALGSCSSQSGTSSPGSDGGGCAESGFFYCYGFCGSDVATAAVCTQGAWTCPEGTVSMDQCPSDTCLSPPQPVCCDAQGILHTAICPDHGEPVCAAGQTRLPEAGRCPKPPGCEQTGCSADQYCDFADTSCGAGSTGQCQARPTSCPAQDAPVCGCDNKIYPNQCEAARAGVALGTACKIQSGEMLCGPRLCKLGAEYCQVTVQLGSPYDLFDCKPVPAGCGAMPDCACLASEPCGSKCSQGTSPGWVKLTCP